MTFGRLNVEPADLYRVAGEYADLQTAAASISPHAVEEVNRIIASHGPMGYPVAVGVVAGLARRQVRLEHKAADFGTYSQRFIEHAEAYRDADHRGAQRFDALDFSEAAHPPTPIDEDARTDPFPKYVCWIGTADGDTSVCAPDTTEYLYVEDGIWKNRQVDNGFVAGLLPSSTPRQALLPEPPAPGSDPFANAAPRDVAVFWPNPDGTMGRAYRQPDGEVITPAPIAPGDLSMWGQLPI